MAAKRRSCFGALLCIDLDTVARVGGDEFVIILSELNADLAGSTLQTTTGAEKVRSALSLPYRLMAFGL